VGSRADGERVQAAVNPTTMISSDMGPNDRPKGPIALSIFSTLTAAAVIIAVTAAAPCSAGCLEPREIPLARRNVAPKMTSVTRGCPVERGEKRPLIDGVGWVVGIPRKIILWDCRVDNHNVSCETEQSLEDYLEEHQLDHVKVRINQYAPVSDWRRLRSNTSVAWPYRYTLGALSVACEAVLPGRIFGRDYYNPYTATVHVYSDVPALAIKQAGHSKDFTRRAYPGTYSLATIVPVINLWPEAIATGDVLAYAERHGAADLEREEYRILYPSYGASLGGVAGDVFAGAFLPVYAGAVVAGHVVGRWEARRVDSPADASAFSSDTTLQTALQADIDRLPRNDSSDPEAALDDAAIMIATAATPPASSDPDTIGSVLCSTP
jgi:hypothetical protein